MISNRGGAQMNGFDSHPSGANYGDEFATMGGPFEEDAIR